MSDTVVGLNRIEQAKETFLEEAARAVALEPGALGESPDEVVSFLRRYFRHVATEDLTSRSPADVAAMALSHRELAGSRPQGTAAVRVFTPDADAGGGSARHTVVEVVCSDMPFLVDSVTAELSRHDRAIHLVVHPQLVVRRDVTGALLEVCNTWRPPDSSSDAEVESWMHVEIDREPDEAEREGLATDLQRVLRDVREAVEDWPKMRSSALKIAEGFADAAPAGVAPQEAAEATELMRWLADDHFTFMGYREYVLVTEDGAERLDAIPGSGLGILRSDPPKTPGHGRLPAAVRERVREPRLLVLTKANSRSTVHRPAYLDYVGVKVFDDAGEVVGERRFLGLFTSAAYNESIQRIPVLRRKAAEVRTRSGFTATSHSGKDLLQILETYPRDELFQISVADLEPIVVSVLHLQERRQ
ncbi:MAG: NAD-glutamate dehydrogenase, partial [Actinomycetes bacterium]